jgi:hypothetical protein
MKQKFIKNFWNLKVILSPQDAKAQRINNGNFNPQNPPYGGLLRPEQSE